MKSQAKILFLAKAIPEGARWITVHPNGDSSPGQPVLIKENPDGSAHVIGGAGGKLNYLKLRGVRSKDEYKREAEDRKKAKQEARKEQRKRDKEAGIAESKQKAKKGLAEQLRAKQRETIERVAELAGWDKSETQFDESAYAHLSDKARDKLRDDHHKALLARVSETAENMRRRLVEDASAREDAGIGEIPLDSKSPDVLSVNDIAPLPEQSSAGLGFSADYKGRAAESMSDDELKAEADAVRAQRMAGMTDSQRDAAVKRGETAKLVKRELDGVRRPAAPTAAKDLSDAKAAVEILKQTKALAEVTKQAQKFNKEIDTSAVEPKAYVLEYSASGDLDKQVSDIVENDLRTIKTHAFLSEFRRLAGDKPEETLGKHIGVGAYNSVNALALAVSGDAIIDRSVVDVLGIAGAAQVLARRIHRDMPDKAEQITRGMEEFHLHSYMETSEEALSQARDLMEVAHEINVEVGEKGADLATAQELNAKRRHAVHDAQKILGQALGEMEANAALVTALREGAQDHFEVSLGKATPEAAIQQARAIGLQRGDYELSHAAGNTFLRISAEGLDRLAAPIKREDFEQVQRNLDIINGRHDEDGWLPKGVANRPDLAMDIKTGVAPSLAEPFAPGPDLQQSLRDYIGGRIADGDMPADVLADIQSYEMAQKGGDGYAEALDAVAPNKGEDGKQLRAEDLAPQFEKYADEFTQRRYGGARSPLHRQRIELDETSVDALHRALAEHPEGAAAYKQIGELSGHDQRTLREYFYRHIAREDASSGAMRRELEHMDANEPERESEDMFGERSVNPDWQEWKSKRDELAGKVNAASLDWNKYLEVMGGNARAYEAVQDAIKSDVARAFAENHNKLRPDAPVKVGKALLRNNLNHLDAVDPEAREARLEKNRQLIDSLRERNQGRYAAGSVSDKMDAAREQREAFEQSQMGFFGGAAPEAGEAKAGKLLPDLAAPDERYTLGHEAERQIAGMMGNVGQNFKPGEPTKMWSASMSGGKNYARQRLVKMVEANKRVVAAFGTGSGKSLLQLSSFTHLHQQGKVKRGLFLVPSIVQGQFNGEALRYLEPGKFNWHIQPGASRDERIAAYKNPDHHFCVMTHQSFRDDMVYLGAKHAGLSESAMAEKLGAMAPDERKAWMHDTMKREGIDFDYLTVDESQHTLNRAGKENSQLANVVDALSANTPYYLMASGDPVKNDASEVYDLMHKMAPERYNDRAAFMRRYGVDTLASKDALRREMARYVYPSKIDPDVTAHRRTEQVELSDGQRKAMAELDGALSRARLARMQGKVDVDAVKAISPSSFEDVPEDQREALAKDLQANIGILKSAAVSRVINSHEDNAKIDRISSLARERHGKPGVVFAHSIEAVKRIAERLEKEGHRVVVLTGADSAKEKDRKRLMFSPEDGAAQADILVASDAGATGMNIQRGQWLVNMDVPQTAMVHAQRNGRIFRTGQKNDVELIDLVANHPEEQKARDRLSKKYALRELMTSSMEGLDDTGVAHYLHLRENKGLL